MNCPNLKELYGDRFKVRYEESYFAEHGSGAWREDPWLMILLCQRGHICPWGPDTLAASDTPERDVELAQLEDAVAAAVEALPPRRREVFRLARERGFSYPEIAEITELSRQTVANHMSLAFSDLRVMLRPFLQTAEQDERAADLDAPSSTDTSQGRS